MGRTLSRPNNSMAAVRWSFRNGDGARDETPTSSDSRHHLLGSQDDSAGDFAFAQQI